MKINGTLRQVTLCLLLAGSVWGQASFALQNRYTVYGVDAPVFDSQGVPLAGTNFRAELWGGATSNSIVPALDLNRNETRLTVPFLSGGYFFSGSSFFSVPSDATGGGGSSWLQVRAWDVRLAPTYEEVAGLGLGGYGESLLFFARGSDPFREPPEPAAPLIGLQSFSLRPVPEPSLWALFALGGSALWWAARRRRH